MLDRLRRADAAVPGSSRPIRPPVARATAASAGSRDERFLEDREATLEVAVAVRQPVVVRVGARQAPPACARPRSPAWKSARAAVVIAGVHPEVRQARVGAAGVERDGLVRRELSPRGERPLEQEASPPGRTGASRARTPRSRMRRRRRGLRLRPARRPSTRARRRHRRRRSSRRAAPSSAGTSSPRQPASASAIGQVGTGPSRRPGCRRARPAGRADARTRSRRHARPAARQASAASSAGRSPPSRSGRTAWSVAYEISERQLGGGPDQLERRSGQLCGAVRDEAPHGLGHLLQRRGRLSPVADAPATVTPPRALGAPPLHRSPASRTLPRSRPARISSRQKSGFPSLSSNARRASSGCTEAPPRLPTMSGSMSAGARGPSARSSPATAANLIEEAPRRFGRRLVVAGTSLATRIDAGIGSATTRSRSSIVEGSSHGRSSIASTSGRSRASSRPAHTSASRRAARSAKVIVPCSARPGATAAIPLRAGSPRSPPRQRPAPSARPRPIGP